MTEADYIYAVFFAATFIGFLFFIAIIIPHQTNKAVKTELNNDLEYMRSQEMALTFMRNYVEDKGGATMFDIMSAYYSQNDGSKILIEGQTYPKEDINNLIVRRISGMMVTNWYASYIKPEGDDFQRVPGQRTGVVLPVPDSQGAVNKVWMWGPETG